MIKISQPTTLTDEQKAIIEELVKMLHEALGVDKMDFTPITTSQWMVEDMHRRLFWHTSFAARKPENKDTLYNTIPPS